jgi:hypothetical protein
MLRNFILLIVFCVPLLSQNPIAREPVKTDFFIEGFLHKWDPPAERLILYGYNRLKPNDGPSIDLKKAFPEAVEINILSVALGPNKTTAAVALIRTGKEEVRHTILTYREDGSLGKLWDMYPYNHQELAVDSKGNVFAMGTRLDEPFINLAADYPLIIKYSPSGTILREFLPRRSFGEINDIFSTDAETGDNKFLILGDDLVLWVAKTQELFVITLDGEITTRASLAAVYGKVSKSARNSRVEVKNLARDSKGRFLTQVALWSEDTVATAFLRIDLKHPDKPTFEYLEIGKGQLLGLTRDGRVKVLRVAPSGSWVETYEYSD